MTRRRVVPFLALVACATTAVAAQPSQATEPDAGRGLRGAAPPRPVSSLLARLDILSAALQPRPVFAPVEAGRQRGRVDEPAPATGRSRVDTT